MQKAVVWKETILNSCHLRSIEAEIMKPHPSTNDRLGGPSLLVVQIQIEQFSNPFQFSLKSSIQKTLGKLTLGAILHFDRW